MRQREINQTLIICVCRRPVCLQIAHGETVRVTCECGNVVSQTFPKKFENRIEEIRHILSQSPRNRWEAIGFELLFDELKELEKNC